MEPPRQFNGFKDDEPKFDNFNGFASDAHTTHRHLHSKAPQPSAQQSNALSPSYNDFYQAPPAQQPAASPYGPPTMNRPPSRQQHQQSFYDPNQFVTEPVVSMAKAYGGHFAQQSKQQIEKYISINQLKYYFDVDNSYVGRKLGLIFFPFAHKEWSVKYNHDQQPLPPRHDVNAPDLYLPVMAIVTYILVAGTIRSVKGFVLENFHGTDGRKRKFYLLLIISLSQPFIIWWLTSSLTNFHTPPKFELPEDFEM
uniref:Protein YIF1 n=1 Tax=Romanomermis culicivorax TaxID=13658 RepID=A0A915JP03_ROMCU